MPRINEAERKTQERNWPCSETKRLLAMNIMAIFICSLIHKFGIRTNSEATESQTKKSVEQYIKELKAALLKGFKAKGDFVVFVDECHRTQSGLLHEAMKEILPNAIFIGFTGAPLLVVSGTAEGRGSAFTSQVGEDNGLKSCKLANEIHDYPLGNVQYKNRKNMAESAAYKENPGVPRIHHPS